MMTGNDYLQLHDRSCYPDGTRYQVLLSGARALDMLDDWLSGSYEADVRVRRAKAKRMVVLETTVVVFASRMVMRNPGCMVNIMHAALGHVRNER